MLRNNTLLLKLSLLLLAPSVLSGCNDSASKPVDSVLPPVNNPIITPRFNRNGQSNESAAAKAVVTSSTLNASGSFSRSEEHTSELQSPD